MGSRYQRLYHRAPQWLRKHLPRSQAAYCFSGGRGHRLGMWLEHHAPVADWDSSIQFHIGDENGVHAGGPVRVRCVPEGNPTRAFLPVTFSGFPMRGDHIHVRLFRPDIPSGWKKLAEFKIANPAKYKPPMTWKIEPVPTTRRNQDLEVELKRIALNTAPDGSFTPTESFDPNLGATADLVLRDPNGPTTQWKPIDVWVSAGGPGLRNPAHPDGSWLSFREGITNRVHWTPLPWPNPNGMEFQFLFAREPSAKFATNELIHLKGLPIPKKNEVFESDFTTNVMSIDVEFIGLAGALAEFDFRPKIPSAGLSLQVEASSPSWITRIDVVSVQDEQGAQIPAERVSTWRNNQQRAFRIDPRNNSKTLDVTLAIHRVRTVKFHVKPEFLTK